MFSANSVIEAWLSSVPSSASLHSPFASAIEHPRSGRKRKNSATSPLRPIKRTTRQALSEMPNPGTQLPSCAPLQLSQKRRADDSAIDTRMTKRTPSPPKRCLSGQQTPLSMRTFSPLRDSPTPRASRTGRSQLAGGVGTGDWKDRDDGDDKDGDLNDEDGDSQTSEASSAATMPDGKALVMLTLPRVKDIDNEHPLVPIREMLGNIQKYSKGRALIPETLKDAVLQDPLAEDDLDDDFHFDTSPARAALGTIPRLEQCNDIVMDTLECKKRREKEAAWNGHVHNPMLNLARRSSTHADRLYIANVTTARLSGDLIPMWRSERAKTAKVVDYAVTLTAIQHSTDNRNGSDRIHTDYGRIALQPSERHRTWNPTPHKPIREDPISISIETKASGGNGDKARVQLGTWVAAHYNKLDQLGADCGRTIISPVLPLLVVEGAHWAFVPATRDDENGTISLWEGESFGSTDTLLGVVKVLAVLHQLYDWAQETYRPWIEANVLKGGSGGCQPSVGSV